jgi:stress response protein YsnF/sporulation protein YlmC with PRC-barrel domain
VEREADVGRWVGGDVVDCDGDVVGRVLEIFLDEDTGAPEWVVVAVPRRGEEAVFVPLAGAGEESGRLRVAVFRQQVLAAPAVQLVEGRLSREQEEVLEQHYQATRAHAVLGDRDVDTVGATRVQHDGVEDVPALIRSEEELVVEKRRVPHQRVRLVKRVITETVTRQVEVRREELHVERVPLGHGDGDQGNRARGEAGGEGTGGKERSGLAERLPKRLGEGLAALERRRAAMRGGLTAETEPFRDEVVDVTLYEEEVLVTKRVVPRERVRLRRAVVSEARQLHDELRKERVELQTPSDEGRRGAPDDEARQHGAQTDAPSQRET